MKLSDALSAPVLYQALQWSGGFFGARLRGIERYLPLQDGQRVIDIGCGPGHIVKYLPRGVDYIGFDLDERYIRYAERQFGGPGRQFFCRLFDNAAADEFGPADVVMMNGVLHHMTDAQIAPTLQSIARILKPTGRLFTLDGVYVDGQSAISRYLLDHDRGRFVRKEAVYRQLLQAEFSSVEGWVHHDFSRVPYSFFVSVSSKAVHAGSP
jgi:SAM-dependent methyltransferase